MFRLTSQNGIRRRQLREQRVKAGGSAWIRLLRKLVSWPTIIGVVFVTAASAIALWGEASLDYVVGQRIEQPIYAKVRFQVPDPKQTANDRKAARAKVPSYYVLNRDRKSVV